MLFLEPTTGLYALESTNTASDPTLAFQIAINEFCAARATGKLVGYYHSHPTGPDKLAPADIAVSEELQLPVWVYSVPSASFAVHHPNGREASLYHRQFVLGTHDCVGLVVDYYRQKLGIRLRAFPRQEAHVAYGVPDLPDLFRLNQFVVISPADRRAHDVALICLGRSVYPNHCGVLVRPDCLLHHVANRPSGETVYGGAWERSTRWIVRHKTLL